jgi:uncharacterized membrane protein YbhN (UPF0104 family)
MIPQLQALERVPREAAEPIGRFPSVPRRLLLLARIAVAAGLIAVLWASGRLDLGRLLHLPRPGSLIPLTLAVTASLLLPVWRWWLLLRIQGIKEPLGRVWWLTWAGYFGALVLPGAAGGDLAKGYLVLRRRDQGRARALSTVLADRALGLYSLLLLGLFPIGWLSIRGQLSPGVVGMASMTLGLFLAATLGALCLLFPRSRRVLLAVVPKAWREAWDESLANYARAVWPLGLCLGISMVSNVVGLLSFSLAGRTLGSEIPPAAALLAGPLVVLANNLPVSPGGIGVGESTAEALFVLMGASGGAEAMLLLRLVGAVVALPGLLPALWPEGFSPGRGS